MGADGTVTSLPLPWGDFALREPPRGDRTGIALK